MIVLLTMSLMAGPHAVAGKKVKLVYADQADTAVGWNLTIESRGEMNLPNPGGEGTMAVPLHVDMLLGYTALHRAAPSAEARVFDIKLDEMRLEMTTEGTEKQTRVTIDGAEEGGKLTPLPPMMQSIFTKPIASISTDSLATRLEVEAAPGAMGPLAELGNIVELVIVPLPKGKVKPGKTWTAVRKIPVSAFEDDVPLEMTWTLDRMEGDVAVLSVTGEYDTVEPTAATTQQGSQMEIQEAHYGVTGTARFDRRRGDLDELTLDMSIAFEAKVVDLGGGTLSADLPTKYIVRRRE